jgi:hypothetical protein
VNKRSYPVVVLPPHTENMNSRTAKLLQDLLRAGGTVIACGEPPSRVDGAASSQLQPLASHANWVRAKSEELPPVLAKWSDPTAFSIVRAPGDKGILFHMRRELADSQLLTLVNSSIQSPSAGTLQSRARGIERWDLDTGKTTAYAFEPHAKGVTAKFNLPPSGSLVLFLSNQPLKAAPVVDETATPISPGGPLTVRRVAPNVLTLDYVDITAGGETRTNVYFYQANQFAWQKNGMERNPWDSAVQFKDELITKKFASDSGFTASYHFTIEGAVPKKLTLVIERPDLYTITCNGRRVSAKKGDWWLDKAFGRIGLAGAAKSGENVVIIKAVPFTIYHELEPAYVLGDFALKATERGFVIAPDQLLRLGKWNEQGHPFYSAGVVYRQQFDVARTGGKFVVSLPSWYGSVAKVLVNGKLAGYVAVPPWECDVTKHVKRGANTIEILAIGTLKNTLGPHHGKPGLGSAWPGMFQRGPNPGPPPGANYSTVGYGLFEPFVLNAFAR